MSNKGISSLYVAIISSFASDYETGAITVATSISAAKNDIKKRLDKKANEILNPIIDSMFIAGIKASNKLYKKKVVDVADFVGTKYKYDKEVLSKINDNSVFSGFYDKSYKELYTKREIDNLKRVILSGKYGGISEKEMVKNIMSTINISKKRALMTARSETQRLESAAIDTILQQKKVADKFVKKYHYVDSESREAHKYSAKYDAGNGPGVADNNGYFTAQDGSKFTGPPNPVSPWNCRCFVTLEEKT